VQSHAADISMSSYSQLNNETTGDPSSPDEGQVDETGDILTDPVPDSYGSTLVEDKSADGFYVPTCGLILYIMAFLGFGTSLALLETLNVAIVAMVNQTTVTELDANYTDECPRDPELDYEGGDFNWNRLQQSIALSAFYIGRAFTLVRSLKF